MLRSAFGERKAERRSQMNVGDLGWPAYRAAAIDHRARTVADQHEALTFADLNERVQALATALDELHVSVGGRVGFLGANSLAHLVCCMGIPVGRRILVDLNFRLSKPELEFMVSDCGMEVLVTDEDRLELARSLRSASETLHTLVYAGAGDCPPDCVSYTDLLQSQSDTRQVVADPKEVAAIFYTGGTTGRPKGVMLSHENLLANARHNLIATGHSQADHWLHVCAMFHVAGTANILACTWVGARQFVLPRFDARAVVDAIRREEITHTVLVPTMLGMLLDELDREGTGQGLPSLQHVQYAASPISPSLQRRVLESLSCDVVQFYGMTEAAPTVSCLSAHAHRAGQRGDAAWGERLASIGVPVVGVEAEVRDTEHGKLPAGEIGELWVRGPNVMLGYWEQPEATAAALQDGWYRTGDAARCDSDGYLYLVDRIKDMIISGGENVYSIEVEAVLVEHPAVLEAAVFGIPDPQWGETVHAVVTLGPDATATVEELMAHCRSQLAGYKVPRSLDIVADPLPKSGAGKVLKKELRDPYWAGHERRLG